MTIRHRLTKTDDITPLPKRKPKKSKKKPDDFEPKRSNDKAIIVSPQTLVPDAGVVFKAMLSARFCAAIWSHITDCDETYNYWEPMHYLVYGSGLQTWEYSPEFALRSYTYVLFHAVPAFFYKILFQPKPLFVFYFVRCLLGFICALVETYFYKAVCREFGVQIGRLWFMIQLLSAGMFISSTALLPSSFSMYATLAALAAWWHQRYPLAIFFIAISTLLGWPFAALLALPLCYDVLIIQRKFRLFAYWAAVSGVTILAPMVAFDSSYFGRFVVAPLNIVKYNVFTSHGPDLYGVEPWTFYFVNGFLNYNIIWLLALATPILLLISSQFLPTKVSPTLYFPYYLSLSPLYAWLFVFTIQSHKEERFLFPVYPLIALCGAVSIDAIQKLYYRLLTRFKTFAKGTHYLDHSTWIAIIALVTTSALGLSRIAALYYNYHAPMDLMLPLNTDAYQNEKIQNVCVGKDWYRFPGSFFLPSRNYKLRFLKSEFNGILPAYFTESENGSAVAHDYFNDLNQENVKMYTNYSECHFLFDLNTNKSTELEPNYVERTNEWKVLNSLPFLNVQRSHSLFRAFYIPILSDKNVEYFDLNLLARKTRKIKSTEHSKGREKRQKRK